MTDTPTHHLYDYHSGADLGPATPEQVEASTRAAEKDGGRGAFLLDEGRAVYTAPPMSDE